MKPNGIRVGPDYILKKNISMRVVLMWQSCAAYFP